MKKLLISAYDSTDRLGEMCTREGGGLKKLLISAYDKTDRLREMRTRGREGVKNPENFAYVLNGSPLMSDAYLS